MGSERRLYLRAALVSVIAGPALLLLSLEACGIDVVGIHETPVPGDAAIDRGGPTPPFDAEIEQDAANDAGQDADATVLDAASDGACPTGLPGPVLVAIPNGCIDSTEVTNAQYEQFVAATADGGDAGFLEGGVPSVCLPFSTFRPKPNSPGAATEPVSFVEWCDAYAYCRWAGKHLCTGTSDAGEWNQACTRAGTRTYPYGNVFTAGACNVNGPQAAVQSFAGCQGGYAGISDMVGNVAEWVNDCSDAGCQLRGGGNATPVASCATSDDAGQRTVGNGFGFRCCR